METSIVEILKEGVQWMVNFADSLRTRHALR